MTSTVSVLIPAYNAGRYVSECLESVFRQTFPPAELIVINDGSTDDTLDRLLTYADRISLHNRENRGVCQTLNEAIDYASGQWVAFLDADDHWAPDKLARQVDFLQQNADLDACFGHIQQFVSPDLPPDIQAGIACQNSPQPGWLKTTLLIRREAFSQTGLFNPTYKTGDFVEWFSRAKHMGLRFTMLPDLVAYRRLHRSGLASQTQHHHEFAHILKAHLDRRRGQPV